ncbi:O-antigen ligase family protein [Dyadobacter tibetensis]|uniref:O-antigen ligase family protein n=1 Tax=Dyadobacter tibetensis TaxID=1211851 RepID=UPI000471085C|nr:O-antigen ligase family protein [Dyadobacter tibetensis]
MHANPISFLIFLKKYDPNWLLFLLNITLVLLGYWAANINDSYFTSIRNFRAILLSASILYLLIQRRHLPLRNGYIIGVLALLHIPSIILGPEPFQKSLNVLSLTIFLYYVWLLQRHMSQRHSPLQNLYIVISIFRICYALPIALYYVQRPTLLETNIYGHTGLGLVSNNFGWAASFYLLLTIDRIRNFPQTLLSRYLDLTSLIPALYLVTISGSRSALLAILLALTLHMIRFTRRNLIMGLLVLSSGLILYKLLSIDATPALQRKGLPLERSYINNESRLHLWKNAYNTMRKYPKTIITGVGLNNSKKDLLKYETTIPSGHLHNTYLNYFWDGGILCFAWIAAFFLVVPTTNYLRSDVRYLIFPLHPFVVALFDQQLGPGQFMAFPLAYIAFHYSLKINNLRLDKFRKV